MLLEVRACLPADLDFINELENWAIRETVAHFGETPIPLSETEMAFQAARHPWLVALIDGRHAGFARSGPWKTRESYRYSAEIGIYVSPEFQGCGAGRALYTTLFPLLREAGFRTVIAGITLPNEASVRLHESFGMTPVGVFPKVGLKFGRWHDVGYWSMTLAPNSEDLRDN